MSFRTPSPCAPSPHSATPSAAPCASNRTRIAAAGCAAALALCGALSATGPALAPMSAHASEATPSGGVTISFSIPKLSDEADVPKSNVATVASYHDIPSELMSATLRNYLQLFDVPFSQTGFDPANADDGLVLINEPVVFELRGASFAGMGTCEVEVGYPAIETGEERASQLHIAIAWDTIDGQGQEEMQQVLDALEKALGIEDIEGDLERSPQINCSVLLEGVGLKLDVTNNLGQINIEITPSSSHPTEAAAVDKTELEALMHRGWDLDPALYTPESYAAVMDILGVGMLADTVYANPDATAAEVFDATSRLGTALGRLEKVGVFSFTAGEFVKLMNGALTDLNEKLGTSYVALPSDSNGAKMCVVYDENLYSAYIVAYFDRNGDVVFDDATDVGSLAGFITGAGDDEDFANITFALIMAIDPKVSSIETASNVGIAMLEANIAGNAYYLSDGSMCAMVDDDPLTVFVVAQE